MNSSDDVKPEPTFLDLISVLNVRPSPKPGQTIAYADVRVGPVIILGFPVVKNRKGSGHFVGLPVRFGTTGKAFDLIQVDDVTRSHICKLVMSAAEPIIKSAQPLEGSQQFPAW